MAKEKSVKLTAEQQKLKSAVDRVNEVLAETGTVLQPFMQRGETFDYPAVRLIPKQDNVGDTKVKSS